MSEEQTYTDSALSDKAKAFLMEFKDAGGSHKYVEQIDSLFGSQGISYELDMVDLSNDRELEEIMVADPERFTDAFARAGKETLQIRYPDYAEKISDRFRVRLTNFPLKYSFGDINSDIIGKMVSVSGMVLRMSEIKPRPQELAYTCADEHLTTILLSFNDADEDIRVPVVCSNPGCKNRDFKLQARASKFVDFQRIRIQEPTEDIPPGHRPLVLDVDLTGDLTGITRPGDKISLTGIARLIQESTNKTKSSSFTFHIRLTGNNIEFVEGHNNLTLLEKDQEMLEGMAEHPDFIERLVGGFAPHVKGNEFIKEALIYALVGSEEMILDEGIRKRADIHEFLVGDPGGAKSEMLKFMSRVAPRGFFTSGKGSSGVGITASVIQDKNNLWTLEAGPMVLGDRGLVVIDEFDKMKPEDKSNLHEAMEQQTISIAKGGITTTLTARTTVVAAANPIYGKWDPYKTLYENMKDIPIPLLTRFDLIFVVRDIPNYERDGDIARHIFDIYAKKKLSSTPIETNVLTKFIAYARSKPSVKLPSELAVIIIKYYQDIRRGADPLELTITPRQLEGIIRLSIARARTRLVEEVEEEDVLRAIAMVEECYKQIATDPETGKVDLGILEGKAAVDINRERVWDDLLRSYGGEVSIEEIVKEMVLTDKWTEESAKTWIHTKFNSKAIQGTKAGHFQKV